MKEVQQTAFVQGMSVSHAAEARDANGTSPALSHMVSET